MNHYRPSKELLQLRRIVLSTDESIHNVVPVLLEVRQHDPEDDITDVRSSLRQKSLLFKSERTRTTKSKSSPELHKNEKHIFKTK